jgi:hypothetical protein
MDSRRAEFLQTKGQRDSCSGRVFPRRKRRVTAVREEFLQKKGQSDSCKGRVFTEEREE